MNSRVVLIGMAVSFAGAALLAEILYEVGTSQPAQGSLPKLNPSPASLLVNSLIPAAFPSNDPSLTIQNTNRDRSLMAPESPVTPGVYVTHPYVIAVFVPGEVDSGIARGSFPAQGKDDMVKTPALRFDPLK